MTTKSVGLAVVFVSLVITHAAFVDYRSWSPNARRGISLASETMILQQSGYLQDRKFACAEISISACYRAWWKGGTRTRWTQSGLCAGVFELLVLMKGSLTRLLILDVLSTQPKNKLQLADQLDIDWKAVDRHMKKLLEYNLVGVYITVGTSTVFAITQKGKHALDLAVDYYSAR